PPALRAAMPSTKSPLVHPSAHLDRTHGHGSAAMELLADAPDLEVLAAPVGGGGLLSGTAIGRRAHSASMKVIGVEPEQADDAYRTWKSGTVQSLPASPTTLADGVRTTAIGRRNFEVMFANRLVDAIVTVTEEEI